VQQRFYVETLGCPKNDVDSDKIVGTLLADGLIATDDPSLADLVVVNTCAFIEDARKESIDTVLALGVQRKEGARLVVTGCMAERYGAELAEALPEVDQVAGFVCRCRWVANQFRSQPRRSLHLTFSTCRDRRALRRGPT
jgi:ribosomal protein S12 methylthiotransferase